MRAFHSQRTFARPAGERPITLIADFCRQCEKSGLTTGVAMVLNGSCPCGAAGWTLTGDPGSVTACNCTLCHRYGALWAYDFEGGRISIVGQTSSFRRAGTADPSLEIVFCPSCAGVLAWRGLRLENDGRRRMAVNVRLADLDSVADLSIDHFDGLDTFEDLPSGGQTVRNVWA
jgi:hypothetical protein